VRVPVRTALLLHPELPRARVGQPRKEQTGKTFATKAAAVGWRQEALVALRRGAMRAPTKRTVEQAADELLRGMTDGTVLDRSGRRYKPATIRGYERALRLDVLPRLGAARLAGVLRRDVQDLVDELRAAGLAPGTVHNRLDPLRVIFRRALRRDEIAVDPTDGLELPAVRGARDRVETPQRAAELLAALPDGERALWACAFYAGVRRGELRALRWGDVDLDEKVLRVQRAWDDVAGEQEPKSDAGRRAVPLTRALLKHLAAHKLRTGRDGDDLVFGSTAATPFVPSTARRRALAAWAAASLEPLTPHEARHCAVSYFIACGMNAKEISVYVGHGDVRQTWNRYGHLMPGGEQEAAAKLDAFLERRAQG
jgi:integrase